MSRPIAYQLAESAMSRMLDQRWAAESLPGRCKRKHPDMHAELTREEVMAQLSACAEKATQVWRASVIFIAPPLVGAAQELDRVRYTYWYVMQSIGVHLAAFE